MPPGDRLRHQLAFVAEIDKLKTVLRRTVVLDRSRHENSAEHSWHLALMAVLLAEHAAEPVEVSRVVEMVLVHDLVEIDAGDTFCYDAAGYLDKDERERCAADRLFALLPGDQGARLRGLWEEFEQRTTPEARFAAALDRLQPVLANLQTDGTSWRAHGIRHQQVVERTRLIGDASPALWDHVERLLEEAVAAGVLAR